ncbi:hypothetical protein NKG94_43865 [Micromonospora sp. M12]
MLGSSQSEWLTLAVTSAPPRVVKWTGTRDVRLDSPTTVPTARSPRSTMSFRWSMAPTPQDTRTVVISATKTMPTAGCRRQ